MRKRVFLFKEYTISAFNLFTGHFYQTSKGFMLLAENVAVSLKSKLSILFCFRTMTLEQKNCTIQMLLDLVEVSCKHERLIAARALLYIGQGNNGPLLSDVTQIRTYFDSIPSVTHL
jgi:hypothetical protein